MSELVDCINSLSAKDIIKSIAKTANGTPFYLQTTGGVWTPANIANIEFWYDGLDETTFTLVGGNVTQFNDKSGNNRNLTTGTNPPAYSAVTHRLTFDKTNTENLRSGAFVISQPHTTFIVYKKIIAIDIAEYILGSISAAPYGGLIGTGTSGAGVWLANSGTAFQAIPNDLLDHIHVVVFNGVATNYYLDLAAPVVGNAGTNVMTGVEMGSYNNGVVYGNFEFMETIGYSGIVSDADRALLIAYLQTKWSL